MLTKSHLVPSVKLPHFVMKWNPFGMKPRKRKTESYVESGQQRLSEKIEGDDGEGLEVEVEVNETGNKY